MKQRDAVYAAVTGVLKDAGKQFEDGMNVSEILTDSEREAVHAIVVQGFKAGKISLENTESNKKKMSVESEMNKYVSGLISNWLRKDPRFNGNTKYTPANPGSRAGSSDPQLKALRQLYTQFKGTPKETIIKSQIEARTAALQAEKAKKITVDTSVLPAELLAELGISK